MTCRRAEELFDNQRRDLFRVANRLFAGLLMFEWLAVVVTVLLTWSTYATASQAWANHLLTAIYLGGVIVSLPIYLALTAPERTLTRHVVAIGQMLNCSLLIHFMNGRIEAHFQIFGSLAFLAFYRDWRVLVSASIVVATDHWLRGVFMPMSVFGVMTVQPWRWLEHVGWVAFEDIFLVWSCCRGTQEMWIIATRQSDWEALQSQIETRVAIRTARLRESEARKAIIFESAIDAIITLDDQGRIVEVNSAAETMLGHRRELILGRVFDHFILPRKNSSLCCDNLDRIIAWNGEHAVGRRLELILERADGAVFPAEISINPVRLDNTTTGYTAFVRDISERKETENRLAYQATHDSLTGLPNRAQFQTDMERFLADGAPLALLLIDLDRFKEINDTLGHHAGDVLLRQIGPRMRNALNGAGVVARLGGDEFAILLPGAGQVEAMKVAEALLEVIRQPLVVGTHSLDVGSSIGIAMSPDHTHDPVGLLQCADVAMYSAKRAKVGYLLYSADQTARTPRRLEMIGELRRAIEQDQLRLHYQPKVDLKTGRVIGAEALARWQHPREGLLPPSQFIAIAEETGLIKPLTLWAIEAALTQSRVWRECGIQLPIAVNLAAETLAAADLADVIASIFQHVEARPEWLTLEVTEGAIMTNPARAKLTLTKLRETGVKISIDDFGTGYSSLAYLRDLPADEVKIDRLFVKDMTFSEKNACIVRSVIDLGRNLGLQVVAEGAEDAATVDMLASMGCNSIQGYYFSAPLPSTQFAEWFSQKQGRNYEFASARNQLNSMITASSACNN